MVQGTALAESLWVGAELSVLRLRPTPTFQIVLSGIRRTPERPPRNAYAIGFSGLALARRRRRGRRR